MPDWRDFCAVILVLPLVLLVACGAHEMAAAFAVAHQLRPGVHVVLDMCCNAPSASKEQLGFRS
jgi:hypothetical protein